MSWEEEFQYKPPTEDESREFRWLLVYLGSAGALLFGLLKGLSWVLG